MFVEVCFMSFFEGATLVEFVNVVVMIAVLVFS